MATLLLSSCTPQEGRTVFEKKTENVFDSSSWKQNKDYYRANCLADLSKRHLIQGRTKAQIMELLGKPDNEEQDSTWSYDVHSVASKLQMLLLTFENDKVATIEVLSNP